jgi:hypothetical protein
MEIGRQGMVGNGHTSRVGKEMEQRSQMADIRNTGISHFVLRESDEGFFQSSDT